MKKQKIYEKGITLIALVITIIVLLILAGVTLRIVMNGGIISKSQTAVDKYTEESAREKLSLALVEYKMGILSGESKDLQKDYLDKINAEIIDITDIEYVIELDGYEFVVDKATLKIISGSKSGGVKPIVEVSKYQQDGSKIVEGEKYETLVLTVKVSNKSELTSIDEVILKDEKGNIINPIESIIGDSTADKSFIINKNGKYTAIVKGTKNEVQKRGKKEIEVNSVTNIIYTVSYNTGIDNMDFSSTYDKTKATSTNEERTKLNEIKAKDSSTAYNRTVKNENGTITAIAEESRTNDDEQIYLYGQYTSNSSKEYYAEKSSSKSTITSIYTHRNSSTYWYKGYPEFYSSYSINSTTGVVTLNSLKVTKTVGSTGYITKTYGSSRIEPSGTFFYGTIKEVRSKNGDYTYDVSFEAYRMDIKSKDVYSKGEFCNYVIGTENRYPVNGKSGLYWYVRNNLMKKYKLYKYDEELNLKSIYDVENKEIKTIPIDISNKENNKVMLNINATGNDYKVYISGDNSNWQEVENITSGTQKEIEVSDWNILYVKIETNSSTINVIEVEFENE